VAEVAVLDGSKIVATLRGAFAREEGRAALLQIAADRIRAAGQPYTSVYLYMLHGNELVLEAFAGRETEHTRIPVGTGVCGTAVAQAQDQNVPDVRAVQNYLACNVWTRSELVVLIRRGALILGQIDIDSDVPDPFSPDEEAAVRQVADALAVLL
jgi:L-methionine (R)-S-oxide reductase